MHTPGSREPPASNLASEAGGVPVRFRSVKTMTTRRYLRSGLELESRSMPCSHIKSRSLLRAGTCCPGQSNAWNALKSPPPSVLTQINVPSSGTIPGQQEQKHKRTAKQRCTRSLLSHHTKHGFSPPCPKGSRILDELPRVYLLYPRSVPPVHYLGLLLCLNRSIETPRAKSQPLSWSRCLRREKNAVPS